jgi:hypothetical protein
MDDNQLPSKLKSGVIKSKASALYDMQYKISELCNILNIPNSTIRGWIIAGLPHSRDARNHYWINGNDFYLWLKSKVRKRRVPLLENQSFCFTCRKGVRVSNPQKRRIKGSMGVVIGECFVCGKKVSKGVRYDQSSKLSID